MTPFKKLASRNGEEVVVGHNPDFKALVEAGECDTYIVSTEDGFSPLGLAKTLLSSDLGIPQSEIGFWADWNRFKNDRVTLVALRSRNCEGKLKGVVLAPAETSVCYERFARPGYGRPYRDFYYNVTHEAIAFAHGRWGARKLAISHLSGAGRFHEDIATCNAEALLHYCKGTPEAKVDSLVYIGCCIHPEHLAGIDRLKLESLSAHHQEISVVEETREGAILLHLDWPINGRPAGTASRNLKT